MPKSWKTTLYGWLLAIFLIGGRVAAHQPVTITDLAQAGAYIGLGTVAKDQSAGN